MKKLAKTTAVALAVGAAAAATPASAAIFEYDLTGGGTHTLTIDTEARTGSLTGDIVNATFESPDFADFEGGAVPSLNATLTSITGTRIVRGNLVEIASDPRHPEMLIAELGGTRWNLWANWGTPIVAGDFRRGVGGFTAVPAPGMLGLFGLALMAIGLGGRRRRKAAAAAA